MSRSDRPVSQINSRFGVLLAFSVLALAGCGSSPQKPDASGLLLWDSLPGDVVVEELGEVRAVDGNGCGLIGTKGTFEGALAIVVDRARSAGADAILSGRKTEPHLSGGCRDNRYVLTATLYRVPVFSYSPPQRSAPETEFSYIVPADFEATWAALIDTVSSDFFELGNFEKDSGLLSFSLVPQQPAQYIDCGLWSKRYRRSGNGFEGTYLDWLGRDEGNNFAVRMRINLRVRAIAARQTRVEISTLYEISSRPINFRFTAKERAVVQAATSPGIERERVCQSTLRLEDELQTSIARIGTS